MPSLSMTQEAQVFLPPLLSSDFPCCCLLQVGPAGEAMWSTALNPTFSTDLTPLSSVLWGLSQDIAGLCRFVVFGPLLNWNFHYIFFSRGKEALCPPAGGCSTIMDLHLS